MRVALVTYAMLWGGMEKFILRLGGFLLRQGFDVDVVTTCAQGEWFGKISQVGLGAKHIKSRSLTEAGHSIHVGRILAGSEYDAILLNHARHAQMSLSILPDRVIAIPILHNDDPEIYRIGCANSQAWNVAVGVSPKVTKEARSRVGRERVEYIPYGIDAVPWERIQERRLSARPFRLLFAGRVVHAQKGVLLLPAILRECLDLGVNAALSIIGEGPDTGPLRQAFTEKGVDERVEFRGVLAPESVYDALLESDVLLMPSFYEGLPIIQLEAMACGCVPVVSLLPGITDVATVHGESGILVKPGDASGFAHAVLSLFTCPSRWHSMSASAQAAASKFSVETMGNLYCELLEVSLAGRYPLPRPRRWQVPLDSSLLRRKDFKPQLARLRKGVSQGPCVTAEDTSSDCQPAGNKWPREPARVTKRGDLA